MWKLSKVITLILCLTSVALISCKKKSAEPETNLTVTLVAEEKEAGRCVVLWAQRDDGGNPVPEGRYRVSMVADDFRGVDEFQISVSASHTPSPYDSSSCDIGGGQLPQSFAISANAMIYAPADTVCIYYDLPASCVVLIKVERINY